MRPELDAPARQHPRLAEALSLSAAIFALVEQGASYAAPLRRLAIVAGRPISTSAVLAAFGSTSPEAFARKQLLDFHALPSDLSHEEMLELIKRICLASGDEADTEYWLACLRLSTGDERISDLIFWPDEYFGRETADLELSPEEILRTALAAGARSRVT